jgi:hypothetical protein
MSADDSGRYNYNAIRWATRMLQRETLGDGDWHRPLSGIADALD